MLAPILAACAAAHGFWIQPVSVDGPVFPDEMAAVRAAVGARIDRLPDRCPSTEAPKVEALAASGRTREGGPVCAARPGVGALMAVRGVQHVIEPAVLSGMLQFDHGDLRFHVEVPGSAPETWAAMVAGLESQPSGGIGGGGRGFGVFVGEEIRVYVDVYTGWKYADLPEPARERLAAALAPCRDRSPGRDRARRVGYQLVAAVDAAGEVIKAAHQEPEGSAAARACLVEKLVGQSVAEAAGRRFVLHAIDRALEPVTGDSVNLRFELKDAPALVDEQALDEQPRFEVCPIPEGARFDFSLTVDASGRVTDARAPGLPPAARACFVAAARHVAFTCPEGGAAQIAGTVERY